MDKIAIIGLGYVGLPLAVEFGKKVHAVGFDINQNRVNELNNGHDRTLEIADADLKATLANNSATASFKCSTNLEDIKECNYYIVTVPTPTDKNNRPDLTPLYKASETVGKVLKKGDTVIYESTVYPGVTEEICGPIIEELSGLKAGVDFKLGYSPERINPGDKVHTLEKITKVVKSVFFN
jgi:UDP-N-acetyl-D-galactosamine dehydrogenase